MEEEGEARRTGIAARMRLLGPRPQRPDAQPYAPRRRTLERTRRVVAWFLVVLASLLVPLSVFTVWTVSTVTDTDQYVATLAPLVRERVITEQIAVEATNELFDAVDVQGHIEHALPSRASFLAAPVTSQLHELVRRQVDAVLNSTWFHHLWDTVNRRSHQTVVDVLTGKRTPGRRAHQVIVDVTPVISKAVTALDAHGVTVFDGVRSRLARADTLTLHLATSKQIAQARHLFSVATALGWEVPLVAGLVVVAAVAVAVDRRKALLRVAVGTGLCSVFLLACVAVARAFFVDHAAAHVDPTFTGAVFDILLRFLREWLRVLVAIATALAVLLWLAGPGRWPRWLRATVARGARWAWRRVAELGDAERRRQASAAARAGARWVLDHRDALRMAGVVVAAAVVLFGGNLSVGGIWWTAVGLVLYLAAIAVVMAWARRVADRGPGTAAGAPDERQPAPSP